MKCNCRLCGYEWQSRKNNPTPRQCPNCKRQDYRVANKRLAKKFTHTCKQCGYKWGSNVLRPKQCPDCWSFYWTERYG